MVLTKGDRGSGGISEEAVGAAISSRPPSAPRCSQLAGAVLLAYPNVNTVLMAGGGVAGAAVQAIIDANQPAADRVIDSFASQYAKWLAERPT